MRMKFSIFLILLAISLCQNESDAQTATCDYYYQFKWAYHCFLNTEQANFNEIITKIEGKHETGQTDYDVTILSPGLGERLKTFSSIFCQKFPNLETIRIIFAETESVDENSLMSCENLKHLNFYGNKIRELPQNLLTMNQKLTEFTISYNELTTMPENFFSNQKQLIKLDMKQITLHGHIHTVSINFF